MVGFQGGLAGFATGADGKGAGGSGAGEAGLVAEGTGLTLPGGVERGVLTAPALNRCGSSTGLVAGLFLLLSPQRPTLMLGPPVEENVLPLVARSPRSPLLVALLIGVRGVPPDRTGSREGILDEVFEPALAGEPAAVLGEATRVV